MRVLLVKMSSLGDVIHTFPAITDAAAQGVRFDWVVEEAFAEVAELHPAVDNVIPIAWRRWRRALLAPARGRSHRGELGEFIRRLRARHYDMVLDAQGLLKSGIVTALALGERKCGLGVRSARESVAAAFYAQRINVPRQQHAVARLRQLFAGAFGYALPTQENFGLQADRTPQRLCVLLHGTSWPSKLWPEAMWIALARRAVELGLQIAVPWGDESERLRAQRIANAVGGQVWERTGLALTARRLARAAIVVGVDSGLSHLSAALGVPTLVLYGSTDRRLTGCRGARAVGLQADFDCAPCLARTCRYRGADELWRGEAVRPACYSRLAPDQVWQAATDLMDADRVLSL